MRTYAPDEFLSRLNEGDLPSDPQGPLPSDGTGVTMSGLVKPGDDPSTIDFSSTLACERWSPLPLDLVESIDYLRPVACKDHDHPLVRITLKSPDDSRSDLGFLLGAVSELQGFLAKSLSKAPRDANVARDDSDSCALVSLPDDLYLCCMDENNEVGCTPVLELLKPD
jgi:hypothetical protein